MDMQFGFITVVLILGGGPLSSAIDSPPATVLSMDDKLRKDKLDNYVGGRPVLDWKQPVNINVSFNLMSIQDLNGHTQTLSVFGQVGFVWFDENLRWEPADYDGLYYMTPKPSEIWLPPVGILNSAVSVWDIAWMNFPVLVSHQGRAAWLPTGELFTTCRLYMRNFPFDTQECDVAMGNLVHFENMVNLTPNLDVVNMEFFEESLEYDVERTWVKKEDRQTAFRPGMVVPIVRFSLRLRRKPTFYMLNILIPAVSILVFAVPCDAGEKLSLAITTLLSFSVFLIVLSDNTPQTSENVPMLAIYLTLSICLNGCSLICTVVVLNIHNMHPIYRLPPWVHDVVIGKLGCLTGLHLRTNKVNISPGQSRQLSFQLAEKTNPLTEHDSPDLDVHPAKAGDKGGILEEQVYYTHSGRNKDLDMVTVTPAASLEEKMDHMLHQLKAIGTKLAGSDTDEAIREEWRLAAKIIDRLFFFVFLVIVSSTTLFMVVIFPFIQ